MTVLYTSHYMEEVAELCDRVAIMDDGAVVATGTLPELIARHGAAPQLELELAGDDGALHAARAMAARHGTVSGSGAIVRLPRPAQLGTLLSEIEATGATVARLTAATSNLESVFLALTGHSLQRLASRQASVQPCFTGPVVTAVVPRSACLCARHSTNCVTTL